jgi:hypothetical protein
MKWIFIIPTTCLTLRRTHFKWAYRNKAPALIAFSTGNAVINLQAVVAKFAVAFVTDTKG